MNLLISHCKSGCLVKQQWRTFAAKLVLLLLHTSMARANIEWASLTLDNDLFVGSDSGYTNGFFASLYDIYAVKPFVLARPWLWTLPEIADNDAVNAYTLGQIMVTPEDITREIPDNDDITYSGTLSFQHTYLLINDRHSDKVSTAIGIVGQSSGAKSIQRFVQDVIGADEPKGWDTQLEDEFVFQLTRGRMWRLWRSDAERMDFLMSAEGGVGNFESELTGSAIFRFGRGLTFSYPTLFLNASRISNPVAIEGGWYIYGGVTAGYTFHTIFARGNTLEDSRSIDYRHEQLGFTVGFAYSWQNTSVTLGVNDLTFLDNNLEQLTRYGTLTLAFRL